MLHECGILFWGATWWQRRKIDVVNEVTTLMISLHLMMNGYPRRLLYFRQRGCIPDWNLRHWSFLLLVPLLNRVMCDLAIILSVLNDDPLKVTCCCCCCINSCLFMVAEYWDVCHSSLGGRRLSSLVFTQYNKVIRFQLHTLAAKHFFPFTLCFP